MNIKFLETFIWVVRLESFSSAAAKLNSTQAAISNRIRALEDELGVRLLNRSAHAVSPTRDGRRAMAKAEQIVRLASEFRFEFGGTEVARTISIGIVDLIIHTWFPSFTKLIRQTYPLLKMNLVVDATPEITRQLQAGNLDLVFTVGNPSGFQNIELGTLDCVWVCSPTVRFSKTPNSIEDTEGCPIISYAKGSIPDQSLKTLLKERAMRSDNGVFNTNSVLMIIHLVREGMGIAYLPEYIIRSSIKSGELLRIPIREKLAPMTLHAAYSSDEESPLPSKVAQIAYKANNSYFAKP